MLSPFTVQIIGCIALGAMGFFIIFTAREVIIWVSDIRAEKAHRRALASGKRPAAPKKRSGDAIDRFMRNPPSKRSAAPVSAQETADRWMDAKVPRKAATAPVSVRKVSPRLDDPKPLRKAPGKPWDPWSNEL